MLGRRLPPAAFVPARLPGPCAAAGQGRELSDRRCAIRAARSTGAIVGGLSARDVGAAAAYEGPRYRIAPLKVRIGGAMTTVSVFEPVEERFQPSGGHGIWRSGSAATSGRSSPA